ncbi:MAG: hypothetical protein LAT68_15460 [Cyclobacteriaceae bacterium]|nr:hypothetical protein [Cyclobacteriaceae bacterium]
MSNSKILDIDIQTELLSKPCSAPPSNPGVTIHDRIRASQQMLSSAREEAREVIRRNPFKAMFEREIARRLRVESVEIDVDEEGRVVAILNQPNMSTQIDTSGGAVASSSKMSLDPGAGKGISAPAPNSSGGGGDSRAVALDRLRSMKESIISSGSGFDMRKLDINALREIAETVGIDPSEWGRSKSKLWNGIFEVLGVDPEGDTAPEPKKMVRTGDPSPVSVVEIEDPTDPEDSEDEDPEDEDPTDLPPKSYTERAKQGLSLSGILSRGKVTPNVGENPLSKMPKKTILDKSKEIDLDALLADDDDE